MIRTETSDDELDRLMERIRAEIAEQGRRADVAVPSRDAAPADGGPVPAKRKRSVRLKNLLRREDEAFVDACFRSILGRAPDAGEAAYHRDRLRDGRLRKFGLVEELRFSKAGRKQGVTIKGLRARRLMARLGQLPGVATVVSVARLPRLVNNVHRIRRQNERLGEAVGRLPGDVAGLIDARLDAQAADLTRDLAGLRSELLAALGTASAATRGGRDAALAHLPALVDDRLQTALLRLERLLDDRLARQREELAGRLGQLERELKTLHAAADSGRGRMDELGERLVVLQRAVGHPSRDLLTGPADLAPPGLPAGSDADALYAAFEDRFRGSREDIRARQAAHLAVLEAQAPHLAGLPVVDLGCGRGEWLELLRERSIPAVGVDRNRVFLADNAGRGLDVVEADALDHLRGLADGSLRAVTGFHIIEHLPFATVLALLDESLRVLAAGGLLLLETPNPENLITAAHTFYRDPTHRHPIPPEVATFFLRARGFREVSVRRLHVSADPARDGVADGVLRELLFGPQDYAVIGFR